MSNSMSQQAAEVFHSSSPPTYPCHHLIPELSCLGWRDTPCNHLLLGSTAQDYEKQCWLIPLEYVGFRTGCQSNKSCSRIRENIQHSSQVGPTDAGLDWVVPPPHQKTFCNIYPCISYNVTKLFSWKLTVSRVTQLSQVTDKFKWWYETVWHVSNSKDRREMRETCSILRVSAGRKIC